MSNQAARRRDSEPVLITLSILAGLQLLFAGAGLTDIIGAKVVFMGTLLVGAATSGVQFYLRGRVVAVENVVAYVAEDSAVVAGSALMGVPEGVHVDVVTATQ